jgi:hypothetical protein
MPEAWNKTTGSSSVIIAIIDEGVDRTHEDLSAKMVTGYDTTGGHGGNTNGNPSGMMLTHGSRRGRGGDEQQLDRDRRRLQGC